MEMKQIVLIILMLVLVSVMSLSGCSSIGYKAEPAPGQHPGHIGHEQH